MSACTHIQGLILQLTPYKTNVNHIRKNLWAQA